MVWGDDDDHLKMLVDTHEFTLYAHICWSSFAGRIMPIRRISDPNGETPKFSVVISQNKEQAP